MGKAAFSTLFFALLAAGGTALAQIDDYPGGKDHPILRRYPGSYILHYTQKRFEQYSLLLGPLRSGEDRDIRRAKTRKLEGHTTYIAYQCPKDRSTVEVYKNYELALEQAGFRILYHGRGNEIRGVYNFLEKINHQYIGGWDDPDLRPWFYLSASSPGEAAFVSLLVLGSSDGPRVALAVIEPQAMQRGLITAGAMAREISTKGKVAIYGIHFDFDSATLRPESQPTIEEIAKLLKENRDLKLYIVGHTDSVGSLDYNRKLSERRAKAVTRELVERYKIAAGRLKAFGVGPLAPVATNTTEAGRARNRRVELVKQ